MDSDAPESSTTPARVPRSKSQILSEEYGTFDEDEISQIEQARLNAPDPPLETWTKLKLPYQAPSCPPLPSLEQLTAQTETHSLHSSVGFHRVCRMGNTVIKYSGDASIVEEAETLLFLAENRPQLRIPHVLAVWEIPFEDSNPAYCLMMDYIEGISLEDNNFAELPVRSQDIILAKVSAQIQYLRSLPSEGYYGRVHRQGWLEPPAGIETLTNAQPSVVGPFNTYEEFISAIFRTQEVLEAGLRKGGVAGPVREEEFNATWLSNMAKLWPIFPGWNPHEPKFTWLDPKLPNMIARPIRRDTEDEDWEVFLLDWEGCGWLPAWVQALQVEQRGGCQIRDYRQARTSGVSLTPYRVGEIIPQTLKEFDPNPDWERMAVIRKVSWFLF